MVSKAHAAHTGGSCTERMVITPSEYAPRGCRTGAGRDGNTQPEGEIACGGYRCPLGVTQVAHDWSGGRGMASSGPGMDRWRVR